MTKPIILCDMDGCITDLLSKWLQAYNSEYDDALTVDEFAIDFGGVHTVVKPECGEKIYDYFGRPGFVADLEPLPGAIDGFRELVANPKLDTYICSAFSGMEECAKGKIQWLKEFCPFFDTKKAILCCDKFLVHGNVLLDDSVEKLVDWKKFMSNIMGNICGIDCPNTDVCVSDVCVPVVMTAPHNFEDELITSRVSNFQEFNDLLKVYF